MEKKIMVIGATGLIGNAVAQQLNRDGYKVIIMSRSRQKARSLFSDDFEIVEADALSPESLKYSFYGINGLYISLPEKTVPGAMPNILKYAAESGVQHVAYTSGCTVKKENAWHPMIKGHYEGEKAIVESEVPYTIFRLTMVMDMIPRYANNGKPFIIGKQDHLWSWIYSGDLAKMVSAAYKNEKAKNKKLSVWCPEKYTISEAVNKYNKLFNPDAKPAKSRPYWMANLLAMIVGEKLKYAISIFRYFESHPEEGDPEIANTLLGKPQTGLNEFFEITKQALAYNNK